MKLTGSQYEALVEAFLEIFTKDNLRLFLKYKLEKDLERLSTGSNLEVIIFEVIGHADQENWVGDLIQRAHELHPNAEPLNTFLNSLPARPESAGLITADQLLAKTYLWDSRDFPLVDREGLRSGLGALLNPGAGRVLVISGEKASGKSYSRLFIQYLYEIQQQAQIANWQPFEVATFDFQEGSRERNFDPADVARRIALQITDNLSSMPAVSGKGQDANYAAELAEWLRRIVHSNRRVQWLVLDGMGQVKLPDSHPVVELVRGLAGRAFEEQFLRVVLIAYAVEHLPPRIINIVKSEQINQIERVHLKSFLTSLVKPGISLDADALDPIVDVVVSEISDPSKRGMFELPTAISKAEKSLQEIAAGSGI